MQKEVSPRADDPVAWRKPNEKLFSLLSQIAKKYFCIPGTSVPSDRLFSKAGELVSNRWSRIKAKNIGMMLYS